MRKFQKELISFVLAGTLLSCMTGCGSKDAEINNVSASQNTAKESSSVSNEPSSSADVDSQKYAVTEKVSFEFWHSLDEEWVNPVVEQYNASQDMVTVTPVYVGGYKAIREQVAAAQAAKEGLPGVCVVNYPQITTYADSGVAEPLDEYMTANDFTDNFYEGFMDPLTVDNSLYAFPYGPSTTVIYYNKDLLAEAGMESYPSTWAEFQTWAKTFYEKTGKPALSIPASADEGINYVNTLLINTGVDPLGDGTKSMLGDTAITDWIKDMKALTENGYVEWLNTGASTALDLKTKFSAGETAGILWTTTYYDVALKDAGFDVGIALTLENNNNKSTTAGATLFIPSQNDQQIKNAAFQFMEYMTNDDNARSFALATAYLPTKKTLLDSADEVKSFTDLYPEMKIVYDNMDTVVSKNKSPYFTKSLAAICEDLTLIFIGGEDMETTINKMTEEVDYILSGN